MFNFQALRDRFTAPQRATILDDQGRPALVLGFTVKDDFIRFSAETFQDGFLSVAYDALVVWEDGSVLVDQDGAVTIHNTPAAVEATYAAFKARQEVVTAEGGHEERWPDVKVALGSGAVLGSEVLTAEGVEATAEQGGQPAAKEAV